MIDRNSNDYKWLARFYFGSCNNPKRDIDPYNNLQDFLVAPVNSLRWGDTAESIKRSKFIFADIFSKSVAHYGVGLAPYDIYDSLLAASESLTNQDIVDYWYSKANWS
ncbi:MAG: hypothetical protein KQH79_13985 [Bacteroidetes bacterium]|nr:hypothetical protein [Bacteroidota bacterium]